MKAVSTAGRRPWSTASKPIFWNTGNFLSSLNQRSLSPLSRLAGSLFSLAESAGPISSAAVTAAARQRHVSFSETASFADQFRPPGGAAARHWVLKAPLSAKTQKNPTPQRAHSNHGTRRGVISAAGGLQDPSISRQYGQSQTSSRTRWHFFLFRTADGSFSGIKPGLWFGAAGAFSDIR